MKDKKLKDLFKDSAIRLNKNEKHSTALHSMGGYGEIDHDRICPFRSVPFEDCPLCKIDSLGKL
tara:strand:+ start:274 stop:465 length:192 start_codon:yes stop_codon:yes gene_type:complete